MTLLKLQPMSALSAAGCAAILLGARAGCGYLPPAAPYLALSAAGLNAAFVLAKCWRRAPDKIWDAARRAAMAVVTTTAGALAGNRPPT